MARAGTAILSPDSSARQRLAELLEDLGEQVVVACAAELDELTRAKVEPDLIVLEPDSQKDLVRATRSAFPDALLVAVIAGTDSQRLRGSLAEGADGVVVAERLEQCLGPTLGAVRAGQIAVPGELRMSIIRPMLSTREKQVLAMVVMGFSNGEIARQLHLAESTIKSHLSSAFAKLGVKSRNAAADLILDADGGLGTGILAISGAEGRRFES